jgi:hypothetical protein
MIGPGNAEEERLALFKKVLRSTIAWARRDLERTRRELDVLDAQLLKLHEQWNQTFPGESP